MTKEKKEFRLPQNLEQLVGASNTVKAISRAADVKIDDRLREAAIQTYGPLQAAGISAVDPRMLRVASTYDTKEMLRLGEGQVFDKLNSNLDDTTYAAAKKAYAGNLDKEHRAMMYLGLVDDGMIPKLPKDAKEPAKQAYKALVQVKKELDLAKAIEQAIGSGDMDQAAALVRDSLDVRTQDLLSIYAGYGAPVARDTEKEIYMNVANARKNVALSLINEKNLYGLIDAGVSQNPQGKSRSLVTMYNVYQQQKQFNEQKAKEAAKNKKAA